MATLSGIITPTNVETASSTSTLTNKTINGSNNTITNIPLSTGVTGTLPVANGGTGSTSTQFANLATNVTGTLPIANGGTGLTALGTAAQILAVNSGATALEYITLPAGSSVVRVARTSNTILDGSNIGNLIDYTSGTFTQTITAAATLGSGWYVYLKNSGTGVITIDPNASETIGGVATALLNPGDLWLVQCDGSNFNLLRIAGLNYQIYTSGSGNFTTPAGVYRIYAEAVGGGGNGGFGGSAGAGGGGGYSAGWINTTPGGTISYAVGAGGGGTTTFGALSAGGGQNGGVTQLGGTASGGDINVTGGGGFFHNSVGIGGGNPLTSSVTRTSNSGGTADGIIPGGGGVSATSTTASGARGEIRIRWV